MNRLCVVLFLILVLSACGEDPQTRAFKEMSETTLAAVIIVSAAQQVAAANAKAKGQEMEKPCKD